MNHLDLTPDQKKYPSDHLSAAKSDKRDLNKEIKKCRYEIEYLSKSIGLTKSDTNSDRVFDLTREVLLLAKDKNLETTIGGNRLRAPGWAM